MTKWLLMSQRAISHGLSALTLFTGAVERSTKMVQVDRLTIRARPSGWPLMRQHWGKLLFIHWRIDASLLRPQVPRQLEIDTFDGSAWIGIVPFTMWGIRPTMLPPIPGTSAFHELNVRTYVHYRGVPGVWFFSLDAANRLAVWAARKFYYLPYFHARMSLVQTGNNIDYFSQRTDERAEAAEFQSSWTTGPSLAESAAGSLEFFLTERYCLYSHHQGSLFWSRIYHPHWPLQTAKLNSLQSTLIQALGLPASEGEPLLHYCEKIRVDIWPLKSVLPSA